MAVLTQKAFLTESISTNQTITTIDFYTKTYVITTSAADITITLPFSGGGAPAACTLAFINKAGTKNLIVVYQSGVSITLKPTESSVLIFDGTKWNSSTANKIFVEKYIKFLFGGNEKSFLSTDNNGSIILYINAFEDNNGNIKLATTGKRARRLRLDGLDGKGYWDYSQIGAAGDPATWLTAPLVEPGKITGGLKLNSITTPPIVLSGTYETDGIDHFFNTDTTLILATHSFGKSKITFDNYQWYHVIINKNTGAFHYVHAFDTNTKLLDTIDVTQIVVSGSGTTAVISTGTTTGLSAAANNGHIVVIKGWSEGVIHGRVTAVTAGVSFTLATNGLVDGTYTGLTGIVKFDAYYRIQTSHFGPANITVDADVEKYTPSPVYCPELKGYYLDIYGIPTSSTANAIYRIIGTFNRTTTVEYVISYKSGFDKNDNYLLGDTTLDGGVSAAGTCQYALARFLHLWGNDWTVTSDATNGLRITINTVGDIVGQITGQHRYVGTGLMSGRYELRIANVTDLSRMYTNLNYSAGTDVFNEQPIPLTCGKGQLIAGNFLNIYKISDSGTLTFNGLKNINCRLIL